MSDLQTLTGHFNGFEAIVWFLVALGLPFVIKSVSRRQRLSVFAASFGFVLFGITDLLEASEDGAIPAWLWAFKIACAAILLTCRFFYIGWGNFRVKDRWFLFGMFCLAASVALMMLG